MVKICFECMLPNRQSKGEIEACALEMQLDDHTLDKVISSRGKLRIR